MKFNILLAAMVMAAMSACSSGTTALEQKKKELQEAKKELSEAAKKVKEIEKEIAALDSTSVKEEGTVVKALALVKKDFVHKVNVHGVVEASKNIVANSEASGRITSIPVKEGQKVSKGQVLAVLDASIIRRNMEELKKSLEFATTMFEKQKKLQEKGVGTEVQFLEAKNRKESLEKSLATLQSQLDKYIVRAPISGYIEDVIPKEGEMISPQMPLARLVNLDKVFVEAEISEALIGKVKEGTDVVVSFTNLDKKVNGKIVQTGQYINPQNRTFKIKIDLEEQSPMFKPNLLAVVELTDYKAKEVVVVPTSVVQDDLNGNFVFIVENNEAAKKYVKLGESNTSETQILSGLDGSETIIVKGHQGLVQGEAVNVVEKG